jgi:hypothetical protein
MQFICDSGHKFHYPAKLTINNRYDLYDALGSKLYNVPEGQTAGFAMPLKQVPSEILETDVCPFCQSKTFTEYVEPVEVEQVENVYVYELGSGPQTVLDGLLAQGYRIVNRYAKAYHLEKPTMQHIQPATESQDKLVNAAPIVMRQEKDYISEALETAAAAVEKAKQP